MLSFVFLPGIFLHKMFSYRGFNLPLLISNPSKYYWCCWRLKTSSENLYYTYVLRIIEILRSETILQLNSFLDICVLACVILFNFPRHTKFVFPSKLYSSWNELLGWTLLKYVDGKLIMHSFQHLITLQYEPSVIFKTNV